MAAESKPNSDLTKIDQAIAADADALLQGDFETIDAVLEGVFEEQAALVQMNDKSPAANPRAMASSRAATPPTPPVPVAAMPPPEPVAAVAPLETTIPEPIVVADPIAESTVEASQQPADARSMPEAPDTKPTPPSVPRQSMPAVLKQAIVAALMVVNYPLRFIPTSHKPLVDWVALSLIGWVPVVWILAITLGHKNAHVQGSPEVHEAGSVLASTEVEDKVMHENANADNVFKTSHDPGTTH